MSSTSSMGSNPKTKAGQLPVILVGQTATRGAYLALLRARHSQTQHSILGEIARHVVQLRLFPYPCQLFLDPSLCRVENVAADGNRRRCRISRGDGNRRTVGARHVPEQSVGVPGARHVLASVLVSLHQVGLKQRDVDVPRTVGGETGSRRREDLGLIEACDFIRR